MITVLKVIGILLLVAILGFILVAAFAYIDLCRMVGKDLDDLGKGMHEARENLSRRVKNM
ncbi:hypothetical protein CL622_08550 [archaeon]|nr:hypothetical protein [archaeon]|tara:strand:+ start:47 stop:226 length:180 start_codon:yes stop_codon:yes gene_type:complete